MRTMMLRTAASEISNRNAIDGLQKNGGFSQLIAHGLLGWLYTLWNEDYRQKIANELDIKHTILMCDVMGDIRHIRNAIFHDAGIIGDDSNRLKILTWVKKGPLVFTTEEMREIQLAINTMQVYVGK